MNQLVETLMLAPVLRGFAAMLVSGAAFPLCGVMVLRMNLVPMRYMLMHGVILGGAVSLALSLPMLPVTVAVNLLLVFLLLVLSGDQNESFGIGSAAAMAVSMALASLIIHKAGVTANNTLSLLWGSPFALRNSDLVVLAVLSAVLALYVVLNMRTILAVFYNREVAQSLGIHVRLHYVIMVTLIALVIAVAMKILGALLIDSLLVLPVLASSKLLATWKHGTGMKKLFAASSIAGFIISFAGFILAVAFDLPPSAAVALVAGGVYLVFSFGGKR
jgi:zinc transport system permease protein